jgi:signal transduction histidine kinase
MTDDTAKSLFRFIFAHYARSALIPILTIELLVLVIYFSVNAYTNYHAQKTLENEVASIMPHIVKQRADLINADFQTVMQQTKLFARAHEELFAHPKAFGIIGEPPGFAVAPTGALYQTNRQNLSSLYFTHADRLDAEQLEKARLTAALDPLYEHIVQHTPHVVAAYLNTPDNMNRLYPFIPKAYEQYSPDLTMSEYNFFYLADEKHNPQREDVWTGAYLDPAGQGWMISCVAPVYRQAALAGVVGLDVTISNIVAEVLSQQLPWGAAAFLADQSGMILAMPPEIEKILGLTELKGHVYDQAIAKEKLKPEDYNLLNIKNSSNDKIFSRILSSKDPVARISLNGLNDRFFIVHGIIKSTGWKLFVLIDSNEVLKSVHAVAALSRWIGLALVQVMVVFYVFFFLFLRKRARIVSMEIAAPVANLALAARTLATGVASNELPLSGIAEIDELTATFSRMMEELDGRSRALVESQVREKTQAKEAQLSFARGMFESASGYLHNVGNSITRLEYSLLELDEVVASTGQYPAVFEKIARDSDVAVLDRFREVLVEKTTPKLREINIGIRRVKDNIQQTIRHQQQSFKYAKTAMIPAGFDWVQLIREAVAAVPLPTPDYRMVLDLPERAPFFHHRNQMLDGITNMLKNAVEACESHGRGTVTISLHQSDERIRLSIRDTGVGILPENRVRVLNAGFTTKPSGNGLGLHSFAVFLSANNGQLSLASEGLNLGTTVTVEVQHARP